MLARHLLLLKETARRRECIGMQVLDGYVYLGNVSSLGEEVMAAFAEVMGAAALKVTTPASCQTAGYQTASSLGLAAIQVAALTTPICGRCL